MNVMNGTLKFQKFAENDFQQVEPLDEQAIIVNTGETIKLIDGMAAIPWLHRLDIDPYR